MTTREELVPMSIRSARARLSRTTRAKAVALQAIQTLSGTARDALFAYAKTGSAVASLAKELLEIEATGDRARAEAWFQKYDKMPADLAAALKQTADIPVDIDPRQPFPEGLR